MVEQHDDTLLGGLLSTCVANKSYVRQPEQHPCQQSSKQPASRRKRCKYTYYFSLPLEQMEMILTPSSSLECEKKKRLARLKEQLKERTAL
ncbi:hypothetical protein Tco_0662473 [Tanacetum coccineum]